MSYHLPDGSPVSYVGSGHDGRTLGERGQLLTTSGRIGHVKWAADDAITAHDVEDLAPTSARRAARTAVVHDDLADSLDVGPLVATGVRQTLDTEGPAGVLNALSATGSLSDFSEIAEEAVAFVEQRVRASASFQQVARQIDDDEFDEVTSLAARVLLRDAFGAVDE